MEILIVNHLEDKAVQVRPNFTYPVYGDKETIFGFKDLILHLFFDSVTFKPFNNTKYSAAMKDHEDILKILTDKLLSNDFVVTDESEWREICENEHKTYSLSEEKDKTRETSIEVKKKFSIYKE